MLLDKAEEKLRNRWREIEGGYKCLCRLVANQVLSQTLPVVGWRKRLNRVLCCHSTPKTKAQECDSPCNSS